MLYLLDLHDELWVMNTTANKLVLLKSEMKPDSGLISTLTRLLLEAKQGNVLSASFVIETPKKIFWLTSGEVCNEAEHVMGLEKLKYDLMFQGE